ncbi:hypothetical protein O181_059779 [Austropuccinia psidii MF-1]|uniref:Secreted protein n=1 Tax=Austropuccinia psidii MF-1 TaxID=1389203 RepID=A0A9Q3EEX7_9BASI|nr:hypothetical protein [Austropuccinia psidii MF-1]
MPLTLLTILTLVEFFTTCLQCCLPSLRLYSALPTCLQDCLPSLRLQFPPNMQPTLLTILTLALLKPLQDETMTPPPISALTTPYTSAPCLIFSSASHPYAPAAPS